jgi:hypothetical protein
MAQRISPPTGGPVPLRSKYQEGVIVFLSLGSTYVDALGPADAPPAVDYAKIRATVLEVYKAVRRCCREALVLFYFFLPFSP